MDETTLRHQVALTGFAPGVQVQQVPGPGLVLRATDGAGRGLEVQLTDEAARLYGEGPAVSVTLDRLKQAADAGLPEARPDGTFERLVFVGD
ncbi:hypothetical protein [Deinococcus multiflagellatus]|uniref:Uncharacterized protein n=1 Tax=Deinococcus multiflagellatus TaxID=1656887 RepID=A0ABW1ZIQ4_9DEIO|nr:hypothetical protein [Deinococcus multiflagellatus]MBZ9712535.1 hypothetical protein [Deinococcus multiflagellatus]